jgi:predicted nucleic acid-binding protein
MSAGARFLIDTNVLVYADDVNEVVKRDRARAVIAAIGSNRSGLVTTQVLGEYLVTVARRFAETLSPSEGIERLEFFAEIFTTQSVSLPVVREAARGVERYGMAYRDAQIWASARLAGIGTVLTEDLPGQPEIEGVRFLDPFAEGFELEP